MATVPSSGQKIPFNCPHCGHYTEVELKFAGRSGPCVGCSNIITVPTYEQITAPAVSPIIRPKRKSEAKPLWIKVGMGLGAVISLAVIGASVRARTNAALAKGVGLFLMGLWVLGSTVYRVLYVGGFFVATIADTSLIWTLSYITVALMTIPNLVGIFLLRKEMKSSVADYWSRVKH